MADSEVVVRAGDRLPLVVEGLGLHAYHVRGYQERPGGEPRVSGLRIVQLSETRTTAEISLELAEYGSLLRVLTLQGVPLEGALVTVGEGDALAEIEPGVFALYGGVAQPGSALVVSAPGYAPTCVPAPSASSAEVRLGPGRQVRFIFSGVPAGALLSRPPGRLLWQGSPCAVPMRRFVSRLASSAPAEGLWIFDGCLR